MAFTPMLLAISLVIAFAAAQDSAANSTEPVASPPPLELVLPLPDPNACSPNVFNDLTKHYRSCANAFYTRHNPDEDCCEGIASYYGANSTRPSRNCFCIESVWTEFTAWEDLHYYSFSTAFLICSRMGYVVPFWEENAGYCYGVPPDPEVLESANMEGGAPADKATSLQYMKKLHKDPLVTFAFATSIISGFGLLLLFWPLVWEAGHTAKQAVRKLSS